MTIAVLNGGMWVGEMTILRKLRIDRTFLIRSSHRNHDRYVPPGLPFQWSISVDSEVVTPHRTAPATERVTSSCNLAVWTAADHQ